ncbi:MAG: hypothetical protein MSIBF_00905 [Candidatus Altiarchaeales archaeon IMC4]|nr:MAG: hypothetical protein MSIBF_00905 [Candidatus Altiarchaeales archaeon IMC4]
MKNKIKATTDIASINKHQSLVEAMDIMEKRHISHLLVRENDEIIGIVTGRDIARKLADAHDLATENKMRETHFHVSSSVIMDLKTISPDTGIIDAAKMMIEDSVSALPIVEDGKITGIVTKTDLIKELVNSKKKIGDFYRKKPLELPPGTTIVHARKAMIDAGVNLLLVVDDDVLKGILSEKDIASGLREFRRALDKYKHADIHRLKVDDFMTRGPATITKDDTVSDAVKIMLDRKISGLPVVSGTSLVAGILTKTDLVKGMAEGELP